MTDMYMLTIVGLAISAIAGAMTHVGQFWRLRDQDTAWSYRQYFARTWWQVALDIVVGGVVNIALMILFYQLYFNGRFD